MLKIKTQAVLWFLALNSEEFQMSIDAVKLGARKNFIFKNWAGTVSYTHLDVYKRQAHGISAASGKIGAIIAQTALGTLIDHNCAKDGKAKNCWLPHVMEIFALFMLLGIFSTLLIPETKRKTLEEISEQYHGEINPSKYVAQNTASGSTASSRLETV